MSFINGSIITAQPKDEDDKAGDPRQEYTRKFKELAVAEVTAGESVGPVSRERGYPTGC